MSKHGHKGHGPVIVASSCIYYDYKLYMYTMYYDYTLKKPTYVDHFYLELCEALEMFLYSCHGKQ